MPWQLRRCFIASARQKIISDSSWPLAGDLLRYVHINIIKFKSNQVYCNRNKTVQIGRFHNVIHIIGFSLFPKLLFPTSWVKSTIKFFGSIILNQINRNKRILSILPSKQVPFLSWIDWERFNYKIVIYILCYVVLLCNIKYNF